MHIWKTSRKFSQIARRWRDFAEGRQAAYTELYDSGEWIKHYAETDFRLRVREAAVSAKKWDEVAAALPAEPAASPGSKLATQLRNRTTA
jgi:hypothetical protein